MSQIVAFVLGLVFGLIICSTAYAHGEADWINKMQLGCCGVMDCTQTADGTWVAEGDGYRNQVTGDYVAARDTKASIDEHYWECRYPTRQEVPGQANMGAIRNVTAMEGGKCLFVPAIGF